MKLPVESLLRHRKRVILIFLIVLVVSFLLIPLVSVNYDMRIYLPEDSQTSRSLALLEETFGIEGSAQVMVPVDSLTEALSKKEALQAIEGVGNIFFLDDLVDPLQPLNWQDPTVIDDFYRDGQALFTITFTADDYSAGTAQALRSIRVTAGEEAALSGPAVRTANMSESVGRELLWILLVIVPLFLVILLLFTHSFAEAILFLLVIGTAVVINIGTNSFFPHVSFMTHLSVAVLQLAISMDYSIFLLHRFGEERAKYPDLQTAMVRAVRGSFAPITASALTTMAGFLALTSMRYTLGRDMGLVLSKGILLSLASVLFLLPVLTLTFIRAIDKTTHRNLLPTFRRSASGTIRIRFATLPIWLILAVLAFLAQGNNSFIYGESAIMASGGSRVEQDQVRIDETFGRNNQLLVMLPAGDPAREYQLAEQLISIEDVRSVQGLATIRDPALPRELLPDSVIGQFEQNGYRRLILSLDTVEESDRAFAAVEQVRLAAQKLDPQAVVFGPTTSVSDIRQVVETDYTLVNALSILAVGLILLFTFKSLLLPVLLVLVIESAIWLNMAIPYFLNQNLSFIGYMIVSAVQLGATIDYAILLTSRYQENRMKADSTARNSGIQAIRQAGGSVLMSAGILTVGGLSVWFVSSIEGIRELGLLIGRGAILSGVLVLIVLPQMLIILDGLIRRSSFSYVRTYLQRLFTRPGSRTGRRSRRSRSEPGLTGQSAFWSRAAIRLLLLKKQSERTVPAHRKFLKSGALKEKSIGSLLSRAKAARIRARKSKTIRAKIIRQQR